MEDNPLQEELDRFRNEWRFQIEKRQDRNFASDKRSVCKEEELQNQGTHQDGESTVERSSMQNVAQYRSSDNKDYKLHKFISLEQEMKDEEIPLNKAKKLYVHGIECERDGNSDVAVIYYREAIRLVPDIEKLIGAEELANVLDEEPVNSEEIRDEDEIVDIIHRFEIATIGQSCLKQMDVRATHISALPREILLFIFKWVVSSEVDMRSLEQLSMVSRGFYICARDPELWRLACYSTFGELSCLATKESYSSWREMFIVRPHVRFDGAYISKTSYVRQGEKSLDRYYHPYHVVDYYRYLRFYDDGTVMYITSPSEPAVVLPQLHRRKASSSSVSLGSYSIKDDKVLITVQRAVGLSEINVRSKRAARRESPQSVHTLSMEFNLIQSRKAYNWYLSWSKFTLKIVTRSGQVSTNSFDIDKCYKPLYFSRVVSFAVTTNSILAEPSRRQ